MAVLTVVVEVNMVIFIIYGGGSSSSGGVGG